MVYKLKNIINPNMVKLTIVTNVGLFTLKAFNKGYFDEYKNKLIVPINIVGYTNFSWVDNNSKNILKINNKKFTIYENPINNVYYYLRVGKNQYIGVDVLKRVRNKSNIIFNCKN